ncbi:MAG: aminotransferase class III-fold pyridoxal phosphate-dependent enzyme [Solirubrobacterales bacterium]
MRHSIDTAEFGPAASRITGPIEACVHCGFCLPTCPTYVTEGEEMDSPRGRIFLIREVLEGSVELEDALPYIDNCLGCEACVTACPSGVEYGDLITAFRERAEIERTDRGAAQTIRREILMRTLPRPRRFRAAARAGMAVRRFPGPLPGRLAQMTRLLPSKLPSPEALPELHPATGVRRATVALLAGCAQQVLGPEISWATLRVLSRNGVETIVPPSQACCGALAMHAGDGERARATARANLAAFGAEVDAIVTTAAGCGSGMREYAKWFAGLPEEPRAAEVSALVMDVAEFLDRLGLSEAPPPLARRVMVAYQDACHLAHAQKVREAPRRLLSSIEGLVLREPEEWQLCCGSAGTYNVERPGIAEQLGERKVRRLLETGADLVASGNIGCMVQIEASMRSRGKPVWDVDGREYLDAVSGTNGTALVGHNNPAVSAAVDAQMKTLTNNFYVYDNPPAIELAARLAAITPGHLEKAFFCLGGGEAIEAAVKLAMRVTGRTEVVSLYGAYHGTTLGVSGLGGMPAFRDWMPGAVRWPTFRQGPAAYCYRCPLGLTPDMCGTACADALETTITTAGSDQVAALVIEPVQGPGGHVEFPPEWYEGVQEICVRRGILLIVDEVQTGLGRCGRNFASDIYRLQPDILVLGKALGGGLPFAATIARAGLVPPEIETEPWIAFTFQNQPVGSAAGLAVLGEIERHRLPERAAELGTKARSRLDSMRERYGCIGEIRGPGLFLGVELVRDRDSREPATEACAAGFDHAMDIGLLTWFGGPAANVLKIKPPLTTTDDEFDRILDLTEETIAFVDAAAAY